MGVIVIVAYKSKPGKYEALKQLCKTHVPRLKKEKLVTDREPVIMEAANETIVEIFEWLSDEAIKQAHSNSVVHQIWAEYGEVCDYVPFGSLTEAGDMFASFQPVE